MNRNDNVATLIELYKGDMGRAEKVYSTLKFAYDHHASNVLKPIDMYIDEHLHYINGFNNYLYKHIMTYYHEARK